MAGWLASVGDFLFGDPSAEGLQGRVSTYEELHAEVQGILIPAMLPRGVSVRLLQPLNKNFALTHRCVGAARLVIAGAVRCGFTAVVPAARLARCVNVAHTSRSPPAAAARAHRAVPPPNTRAPAACCWRAGSRVTTRSQP